MTAVGRLGLSSRYGPLMTSELCGHCGRKLTLHWLSGTIAYCDPPAPRRGPTPAHLKGQRRQTSKRAKRARSTFTVAQVNELHRVLGHPVSEAMVTKERDEKRGSK